MIDWTRYPNFTESEFRCKHTGKNLMQPAFLERLQALREAFGKPMPITSGYRSPTHPIEARKAKPGAHTTGRACDVAVQGAEALRLVGLAIGMGFTGVGIQQKGAGRFIHLDDCATETSGLPRPGLWSY